MDTNRDYKISLNEWLNHHDIILNDFKLYESEIGSLVNLIFDTFDTDEDGAISSQEWLTFMGICKNHRIYAGRAFWEIDTNKDGFLSKEEFLKAFYDFYHSNDPTALGNLLFMPY
jgi:Ca2+-binding EF-hand superfamily protein